MPKSHKCHMKIRAFRPGLNRVQHSNIRQASKTLQVKMKAIERWPSFKIDSPETEPEIKLPGSLTLITSLTKLFEYEHQFLHCAFILKYAEGSLCAGQFRSGIYHAI